MKILDSSTRPKVRLNEPQIDEELRIHQLIIASVTLRFNIYNCCDNQGVCMVKLSV